MSCSNATPFDESIDSSISILLQGKRCGWCRSPQRPIRAKGLCASCYKWDKERSHLTARVKRLPPRIPKDPYSDLRHELDVANCAVELCQIDGELLDDKLRQTDSTDLENAFDTLARKLLRSKRTRNLFHCHSEYFYEFSLPQRRWLWHLVSRLTNEVNRRDRRQTARSQVAARASGR